MDYDRIYDSGNSGSLQCGLERLLGGPPSASYFDMSHALVLRPVGCRLTGATGAKKKRLAEPGTRSLRRASRCRTRALCTALAVFGVSVHVGAARVLVGLGQRRSTMSSTLAGPLDIEPLVPGTPTATFILELSHRRRVNGQMDGPDDSNAWCANQLERFCVSRADPALATVNRPRTRRESLWKDHVCQPPPSHRLVAALAGACGSTP